MTDQHYSASSTARDDQHQAHAGDEQQHGVHHDRPTRQHPPESSHRRAAGREPVDGGVSPATSRQPGRKPDRRADADRLPTSEGDVPEATMVSRATGRCGHAHGMRSPGSKTLFVRSSCWDPPDGREFVALLNTILEQADIKGRMDWSTSTVAWIEPGRTVWRRAPAPPIEGIVNPISSGCGAIGARDFHVGGPGG